jgi:hypothetical protein
MHSLACADSCAGWRRQKPDARRRGDGGSCTLPRTIRLLAVHSTDPTTRTRRWRTIAGGSLRYRCNCKPRLAMDCRAGLLLSVRPSTANPKYCRSRRGASRSELAKAPRQACQPSRLPTGSSASLPIRTHRFFAPLFESATATFLGDGKIQPSLETAEAVRYLCSASTAAVVSGTTQVSSRARSRRRKKRARSRLPHGSRGRDVEALSRAAHRIVAFHSTPRCFLAKARSRIECR